MASGTVKFWKGDKGWGAIMSEALPAGADAWAHFSVIESDGYRELHAGDLVDFDYETAQQDSFRYRATRVVRIGPGPAPRLQRRADGTVEALPPESRSADRATAPKD
jgi:CspA family cold shock protein